MMRAHTEAMHLAPMEGLVVNTQDVFHAALVPAALFVLLCGVVVLWQGRGAGPEPAERTSRSERLTAVFATVFLVVLLAGVALGYLYAVEAAATGGVALVLHAVITGSLRREHLGVVLRDAMAITGSLFALLVAANVFTLVARAFGTDRWLVQAFAGLGPGAVLATGLASIALCALVLDAFEMIFVVIPLVAPAILTRVPDAPWVSVLILLILQASFLIPPFGYAVMMARTRVGGGTRTMDLLRAVAPFLAAQFVVACAVLAFPGMLWRESVAPPATSSPANAQTLEEMLDREQREAEPAAPR